MGPGILIVNVNWVGDVLFSTPAIRAIRKKYPEHRLACLAPKRCQPLLIKNPYLDEVIVYNDRVNFVSFLEMIATIWRLRNRRFDTAIFFHRSKTKVLIAWLAGIGERIGYRAPFRERLLTKFITPPAKALHKTDYFLWLLRELGIEGDGRTPDFFPDPSATSELDSLLAEHHMTIRMPYVVVHAGGNWGLKRWPVQNFVRWIRLFLQEGQGRVVLCGTLREKEVSEAIKAHFNDKEVISLCGKTSLDTLALLLRHSKFLLSNDSGPIHLAASQKTKIVGVFGPTSQDLTGPISNQPMTLLRKDVGCQVPCYFKDCNYRVCMEWLTPEEVFEAAKKAVMRP